jgi:drug/metabolite transporter (DMT)-like permease
MGSNIAGEKTPVLLLAFLLMTTLGVILYHVGQKSLPRQANPLALLLGVYGVAFAISLAATPLFQAKGAAPWTAGVFSWPVLLLGVGVFVIELGFILVYRSGGGLQWAGVAVNGLSGVLLVPIALFCYGEPFSPTKLAGIAFTLVGLLLLTAKGG